MPVRSLSNSIALFMVCLALGNFFLLSKRQRTPNGHQQGWHSHMRFMVGMIWLDVPPIVALEGQMGRVAAVDGNRHRCAACGEQRVGQLCLTRVWFREHVRGCMARRKAQG
jgi:hypothetical protein